MFTFRDFEGGTLGLAWTGDLKNAGGVCEKNGVSNLILLHYIYDVYSFDASQNIITMNKLILIQRT